MVAQTCALSMKRRPRARVSATPRFGPHDAGTAFFAPECEDAPAAIAFPPDAATTSGRRHEADARPEADEYTTPEAADGCGDALTAEEVFQKHAPRIYNLVRRMLSNQEDVEDVTQEVLLQVVRKLGTFRREAEFTTWLHRVAVNAALVHRRKHGPRRARETGTPVEEVLDRCRLARPVARPEGSVLAREARGLIEGAIARLPEMYRDAFVLADVEGLANAEVGAALGLSVAAVKSRLHRARLLLRTALAGYYHEGLSA
jgi:RNA polymerase sigma-70 factor, ECF subfamily